MVWWTRCEDANVDGPVGMANTEDLAIGVGVVIETLAAFGKLAEIIVLDELSLAPFPNPLTGRQIPLTVLISLAMDTV